MNPTRALDSNRWTCNAENLMRHLLWMALLSMTLTGCISIPEPLSGDFAAEPFPDAVDAPDIGRTLVWGGTLIEARPGERSTCLELLARPLDVQRRPRLGDEAHGRFRACHAAFLDPEIFAAGREVTVVGRLTEFQIDTVGEYSYRFPRLQTETVHLWPERPEFDRRFHDPFWRYHGWPYGGPFWIHYGPRFVPVPVPSAPHSGSAAPRQPVAPVK
jgi:outer membrane lipoprotein